MCLVLLALDVVPGVPVVVAANRDERHDRPASPLHRWPDRPELAGGRDTVAGGTWFAVHRDGRFAVVLNDRRVPTPPGTPPSRGELVPAFLGDQQPREAALRAQANAFRYAGFHLLGGDRHGEAWYTGSALTAPTGLGPGVHGADNAGLDVDDPRLRRARAGFERALEGGVASGRLLEMLRDDGDPGPGAGDRRPVFICAPVFGSRCSTVLAIHADDTVTLRERRFDAAGRRVGDTTLSWTREFAATG